MKILRLIAAGFLVFLALVSCGKKKEEKKPQQEAMKQVETALEPSLFLSQEDSLNWEEYLRTANQDTSLAYLLLGSFYISSGRPDSALGYLETAARYNPERAIIYLNIGDAYNRIGQKMPVEKRDSVFKLAAEAFHIYIQKAPGNILSQEIYRIAEKYRSLESEKEIH
jgi:tetratricopeptide (TPR) repeat protein